jgi:class 3 adenylate cyclase
VLVDAPPALRETGRSGDELAAILAGAACDVAVLVGRLEASVQGPAAPVAALFGGGDHDWAALEIAAAVALARRAPLLLVGVATDDPGRDASRILASASLAIQRAFGVTAEPLLVPREPGRLLAATAGAALVAVGMPARWRHDDVGPHRLELLRNGAAPAVLVRRGLRPGLLAPREAATRFTWSLAPADAGAAAPASTHGERVLLTTLFTDIVASTERAAQLGDGPWRELLAAHRGVLLGELDRFGGRLVDTAGDGMFAVFDAPVRALRCAVAIRAAAREQGVEIRAGVHTGECERDGERVVGIAVHVGARVLGAAAPGEILATGTVRELVAGSGLRFEPRGEHALKGVPEPTRLFALALEAAA